jgi:hypothetical protein
MESSEKSKSNFTNPDSLASENESQSELEFWEDVDKTV